MSHVFLSFSDEDRVAAKNIRDLLRQSRFDVFLGDRDLFTPAEISEALGTASCVIIVCTKNSIRVQPVVEDSTEALRLGIPILFYADDIDPTDLLEALRNAPIVRRRSSDVETLLTQLRALMKTRADELTNRGGQKIFHIGGTLSPEITFSLKRVRATEHDEKGSSQAERDGLYRRRVEQNDVPPTMGSPPRPLGTSIDVLNDRLTIDTLRSWTQRRGAIEPAVSSARSAAPPAPAKGGGFSLVEYTIPLGLGIVACTLLASATGRALLANLLAALGIKLNAFFGFFGHREEAPKNPTDLVDCSVFSPPAAPPGATIMVQVFLHVPEHTARAQSIASMMDQTTAIKGVRTLNVEITRGMVISVSLSANGLEVDEPQQMVVWRGDPVFCQFLLTLPQDCDGQSFHPTVRISVAGGLVGCIKFQLGADRQAESPQSAPRGESARRYEHAFLSYASADRKEVLKRAQVLQAAGVSFFQDILTLDPGVRWEREIYKNIDKCDLFLLFWSQAAKNSEWVIKEAEYALRLRREADLPDIVPVILESPPPAPSCGLAAIHIDDRIHYMIDAS